MSSRNLLKPLVTTLLIANSLAVIAYVSEKEAAKLSNQLTCLGTVATNALAVTPYSGKWIGIPAVGEYAPYIDVVPFITQDQMQALQLHFPYR
jgi:hypothetical protein